MTEVVSTRIDRSKLLLSVFKTIELDYAMSIAGLSKIRPVFSPLQRTC
ncbi:hypothetical protein [Desulfonatronovibrio magnus]|nr:hypothetical protein [Desulfonatronovibrio magnus]